jgi:hypothetical protein
MCNAGADPWMVLAPAFMHPDALYLGESLEKWRDVFSVGEMSRGLVAFPLRTVRGDQAELRYTGSGSCGESSSGCRRRQAGQLSWGEADSANPNIKLSRNVHFWTFDVD